MLVKFENVVSVNKFEQQRKGSGSFVYAFFETVRNVGLKNFSLSEQFFLFTCGFFNRFFF